MLVKARHFRKYSSKVKWTSYSAENKNQLLIKNSSDGSTGRQPENNEEKVIDETLSVK